MTIKNVTVGYSASEDDETAGEQGMLSGVKAKVKKTGDKIFSGLKRLVGFDEQTWDDYEDGRRFCDGLFSEKDKEFFRKTKEDDEKLEKRSDEVLRKAEALKKSGEKNLRKAIYG